MSGSGDKPPGPTYWRYQCRRCTVQALYLYPAAYLGHKGTLMCPGCDSVMEVIERPERPSAPEYEDNVVDMTARRRRQITLAAIKKGPAS